MRGADTAISGLANKSCERVIDIVKYMYYYYYLSFFLPYETSITMVWQMCVCMRACVRACVSARAIISPRENEPLSSLFPFFTFHILFSSRVRERERRGDADDGRERE